VDAVTAVLINKVLDGLSARAQATAQNIANANSPGYRPVKVTFEDALRLASRGGPGAVGGVAPSIEYVDTAKMPAETRLDLELATASETAMRYAALMDAMEISRSGLDVEWQRLQVIAQNIANMNTTRTASGEPYRAMRLLSGPKSDFAALLRNGAPPAQISGVQILGLEAVSGGVRKVHQPTHPHADPDGFVTYPDIDHAGEMTLMIKASRVYEANLSALNIAHQMYMRALDLGRLS
jgi:flagellar basal-body rod protein FlgC